MPVSCEAFRSGDYIQTARRAQFHLQRTHWHDLIGDACPRFGRDRVAALLLPKPVSSTNAPLKEYKIQFAFDGDRHQTPWVKLVGEGAVSVPMVRITLRRSGDELLRATAEVEETPVHMQHAEPEYVRQWANASHWPKRLLLSYVWEAHAQVDLDAGLCALLLLGLGVAALLALNAVLGAGPKLTQFLSGLAAELDSDMYSAPSGRASGSSGGAGGGSSFIPPGPSAWKGGGKGE